VTSDFAEVWRDVANIDGWLTEGQARLLHSNAATVAEGQAIVEIGSHHGRSTVVMATAKPDGIRLIAIDPYDDPRWGGGAPALDIFNDNLERRGLSADVEHLRAFGAEAGRTWHEQPVGMLFVDGAHDYPTVRADLEAWLTKLSPEAVVLMHDAYSSPGVTRAMFAAFFGSAEFAFVDAQRTLVAFRRGRLDTGGRVRSSLRMLGRLPWFARNLTIKLAIARGWRSVPPILGHRQATFPY